MQQSGMSEHNMEKHFSFKGAMCNISEDLLTEMQYKIHNYVFRGV